MALKDIFKIIKADRYTQDGRDELNKSIENVTEDVKYNIGDISQKTGLQKTANGWVKPKKGGAAQKEDKVTGPDGKLSERARFAYEKHAKEISNESLESMIRNKDKAFVKHNDEIAEIFKKELESRKAGSESTSTAKFETEQENSQYARGKEGWDKVDPARLPDIKKKVEQKIQYYKSYDPYSAVGKKTGLNAAQKKAVEQNMAQAKENLAFYTGQLEGINSRMESKDAAPRCLTGDCKIRVRKSR